MNWIEHQGNLPTPSEVALTLMDTSRRLDQLTQEIRELDEQYVGAKSAYEQAYARAFLTAEGAMDVRKQKAVLEVAELKFEMELAESRVRSTRSALQTLRDRIEVGRSLGAAVRSELAATAGIST